jgi:3-hydroxyisobutyrate dehydrogenase/glyoxylate/succinic semialdehyde reductase
MKIGFIGSGIMGGPIAGRLLEAGYELVVYNRTKEKAAFLLEKGAAWADSPASVGRQVDVLFSIVADPKAVKQVAEGPQGFLPLLKPGSYWIDCSTVNPSFSIEMAERAGERAIHHLDAPVGGSKLAAARGELLIFVGGEAADLEVCRPLLETFGKKIIHVGGHGQGSGLKMIYNLLVAQTMLAFSEGLLLGESLGISRDLLFDVLLDAPVAAPFLSGKRKTLESGDFTPNFPVKWMHKDLQLISQTGYEQGSPLPGTNLAKEIYALAEKYGLSELDYSAIYRFLQNR